MSLKPLAEFYHSIFFYPSHLHLALVIASICFFGFLIYFVYTKQGTKPNTRKAPPSPSPCLPIFGNLFCLDNHSLHRSLAHLAKIHGPIMLLKLGHLPTVVLSSAEVAKEALQKHDLAFSNRTALDATHVLNHQHNSLIHLPPIPKWRNLRKFCTSHIFAARKLEDKANIRETKVRELLTYAEKCAKDGMIVNIGEAGFTVVLNVLSTTLFSLDLGDPTSQLSCDFRKTFRDVLEELGKPNLGDFFPMLKKMDLQGIRRRMTVHVRKMLDLFNAIIEERIRDRNSLHRDRCNDVLDALLDMKVEEAGYIETSAISHLFLDLITAGADTTSTTFEWAMAELLHNPEKLKILQSEIQDIVGKGNSIKESHMTGLPYLQAVVKETLRLHPPAPIPVPRNVDSDVNIFGYTVPANSMVLVNVWAIAREPSIWDNPEEFIPERFLGSNIDVKGHDFDLIPFGAGRRICPGMPLAIRIMPLMIASLIHEFEWKLEDGTTPESMNMDEKSGFTVEKAQRLRAIPVCR